MKQIIKCKYCNKELFDIIGLINHNCEKSELRKLWSNSKINSGNLLRTQDIVD